MRVCGWKLWERKKKMARGRETAAGFWFQREKEMVEPAGSEK